MLDKDLIEQLKPVFVPLENEVELSYQPSFNENQNELVDMLNGLALASKKIIVKLSAPSDGKTSPTPQFSINYKNKPTGITFRGIPGGHEFSSLVLAILNTDGKGKFPDQGIINRIKKLKGPIEIKTYMSLTCENCPDVVQALNQMALLHPNFKHEVIDGSYAQEEIDALSIQGVPAVVVNNKLIHSGRITLSDLIAKLESTFGVDESGYKHQNTNLGHFDVVVIGGGPAGVSAAIYSVRKGLKTALIAEKIGGQVQETKGIENLISVIYTEGPQLAASLRQHLSHYPVEIFEHRKVKTVTKDKKIELEGGDYLTASAVIVATGAKWRQLNIQGESEYLGRGVAFCPHCDGPFYKGKKVAVIGGGNSGVEAAIDLSGIVGEVVLIEFAEQLKADKILVDKLKSLKNVSIITNAKTEKIVGDDKKVNALHYTERATGELKNLYLDGVFIQIGLVPNSQFLKGVVELSQFGEVIVDTKGLTSIPGIYAAGDVTTTPFKQIIIAMGEGAKVALAAFEDNVLKAKA
ncbi:MAG: alkyl hydroperoxide reductase subunit F [Oligoflexia bacterium]|nr:alkyl hydroperoxide reductase subunit F [Oligoflexia bacterium]